MDFKEREVDFQGADRRYAELTRQRDAGTINDEEFDEQLKRSMVQDESGHWWAKSRKSGEWHYHDGSSWVRRSPPGYSPTYDQNGEEQRRREPGSLAVSLVLLAFIVVVVGGGVVAAAIFLGYLPRLSSSAIFLGYLPRLSSSAIFLNSTESTESASGLLRLRSWA